MESQRLREQKKTKELKKKELELDGDKKKMV